MSDSPAVPSVHRSPRPPVPRWVFPGSTGTKGAREVLTIPVGVVGGGRVAFSVFNLCFSLGTKVSVGPRCDSFQNVPARAIHFLVLPFRVFMLSPFVRKVIRSMCLCVCFFARHCCLGPPTLRFQYLRGVFCELKMVVQNAKLTLPRFAKKTFQRLTLLTSFKRNTTLAQRVICNS